MNTKHTPGPWRQADNKVCADGETVAHIYGHAADGTATDRKWRAKDQANAELIAAAPELLAALKEATRCLEWHNDRHGVAMDAAAVYAARAAIAEAQGGAA